MLNTDDLRFYTPVGTGYTHQGMMNLAADEIDSLRQHLAESQARVKELEELLLEARDDVYECLQHDLPNAGYERYDKRIEFRQKHIAAIDAALANKSPSSALDRAIRQAKVEALEEALEDAAKKYEAAEAKSVADHPVAGLRRMADELGKEN